jgi:ribosomal protein S18 acetylase RimI-like enzyme
MLRETNINIRQANISEDYLIARHFYQMWRDNNRPPDSIQSNWQEITFKFINQARKDLYYQAFIAEVDSQVVGSVSCQLFAGLYPDIIVESYRKYGYIWGVYVEPEYRRQGIGKKLTLEAIAYLKQLACTRAILNASPSGQLVYNNIGFQPSNAMEFDLI